MRFADLDAVTVDGFGTLIELESPLARLAEGLEAHGIHRSLPEVEEAFAAEVRYYRPHAHLARDERSLEHLRRDCVRVFLDALAAPLDPDDFVVPFLQALVFRPVAGATDALAVLRTHGLKLAVVSNWDCALPARLAEIGLHECFDELVTSAEAGAPKPEPLLFRLALERLGAVPERALHVGDEPDDELGARAAGMHFAPAPLSRAVAGLL